jgi:hypothetical protein
MIKSGYIFYLWCLLIGVNMLRMDELLNNILSISQYDIVKHKISSEFYNNTCHEQGIRSKWVEDIKKEQKVDGSWGRFHTQDTRIKQKYPTTENAVLRLKYLSLNRCDIMVEKACNYMERLLCDLSIWPEGWEKNKWFKPAVPLFIASKLAMFGSNSPNYICICNKWIDIINLCFQNNKYSGKIVDSIAIEQIGTPIDGSYIGLSSFNNILLFSHNANKIPVDIQKKYIQWLHNNPAIVGYTITSLNKKINELNGNALYDYIRIMALLSVFGGFANEFSYEIKWLEKQQGCDGFWDFGNKINNNIKLSDNWRLEINRKIDCSIFVLGCLKNTIDWKI